MDSLGNRVALCQICSDTMKVALVTGCSSGLGKALVRTLHTGSASGDCNLRVFATSRNLQAIEDLKLEGIDTVQLDVTDPESVKSAVDHIVQEAGGIDLLVCNAGIHRIAPIVEQDIADVRAVFDTNVFGALLCARAVAPIMIKQRSGIIALVGSIAASLTAPYSGAYSASKSASHSIFEALRIELSPYNVAVSVVESGMFRSSIVQKSSLNVGQYANGSSLWKQAADGIQALADYLEKRPKVTAEETAVAVAKQLCRKQGPPAHFLVAQEAFANKLLGFVYDFIAPNFVHRQFCKMFGLDQKW